MNWSGGGKAAADRTAAATGGHTGLQRVQALGAAAEAVSGLHAGRQLQEQQQAARRKASQYEPPRRHSAVVSSRRPPPTEQRLSGGAGGSSSRRHQQSQDFHSLAWMSAQRQLDDRRDIHDRRRRRQQQEEDGRLERQPHWLQPPATPRPLPEQQCPQLRDANLRARELSITKREMRVAVDEVAAPDSRIRLRCFRCCCCPSHLQCAALLSVCLASAQLVVKEALASLPFMPLPDIASHHQQQRRQLLLDARRPVSPSPHPRDAELGGGGYSPPPLPPLTRPETSRLLSPPRAQQPSRREGLLRALMPPPLQPAVSALRRPDATFFAPRHALAFEQPFRCDTPPVSITGSASWRGSDDSRREDEETALLRAHVNAFPIAEPPLPRPPSWSPAFDGCHRSFPPLPPASFLPRSSLLAQPNNEADSESVILRRQTLQQQQTPQPVRPLRPVQQRGPPISLPAAAQAAPPQHEWRRALLPVAVDAPSIFQQPAVSQSPSPVTQAFTPSALPLLPLSTARFPLRALDFSQSHPTLTVAAAAARAAASALCPHLPEATWPRGRSGATVVELMDDEEEQEEKQRRSEQTLPLSPPPGPPARGGRRPARLSTELPLSEPLPRRDWALLKRLLSPAAAVAHARADIDMNREEQRQQQRSHHAAAIVSARRAKANSAAEADTAVSARYTGVAAQQRSYVSCSGRGADIAAAALAAAVCLQQRQSGADSEAQQALSLQQSAVRAAQGETSEQKDTDIQEGGDGQPAAAAAVEEVKQQPQEERPQAAASAVPQSMAEAETQQQAGGEEVLLQNSAAGESSDSQQKQRASEEGLMTEKPKMEQRLEAAECQQPLSQLQSDAMSDTFSVGTEAGEAAAGEAAECDRQQLREPGGLVAFLALSPAHEGERQSMIALLEFNGHRVVSALSPPCNVAFVEADGQLQLPPEARAVSLYSLQYIRDYVSTGIAVDMELYRRG